MRVRFLAFLVAGALTGVPANVPAQETPDDRVPAGGAWALQFQIEDDFALESFSGGVLSVERFYSTRSALRLGLDLSAADGSVDDTSSNPDTLYTTTTDQTSFALGLELQYVRHMAPASPVRPYWGAGPTFYYRNNGSERSVAGGAYEQDATEWRAGLLASLGVEWFATDHLSLLAEYGLRAEYVWVERTSEQTVPVELRSKTRIDEWRVGASSVRFGLSVYF